MWSKPMVHTPEAQHGIAGSLPVNGFRCLGLKEEGRCDATKPLYMAVCDSTRNCRTFDPERMIPLRSVAPRSEGGYRSV
ncbi:uncharacterized protein STEHIDRAFT_121638 [Stereum hirsutum FP-91666 SS1]|uniref:uncharacterized protein n=1 Tax=Stereum hirsutum (strain FP-91666) TaxID=721885 RepID=UPI0004449BE6|nr:uncharacterized protein STEHIDRAFT_121638 [Stereum hirsutum FP-91666 SS1]EIM86790.1 hypothetical protein STEHIDRAFT_121638 [Stereum hirsutum FP-91666 SS1]